MLTKIEERELIEAYVQRSDQKAFDKILSNFLPMLRSIVRQILWRHGDYEDLMQVGTLALSQATRKFDRSRGNRLAPFAETLIRAEMLRYWRDMRPGSGADRLVVEGCQGSPARLPKVVEDLRQIGLDPYGPAAIEHYTAHFRIDSVTAKSLLAAIHAGAYAAVPIAGKEWEHTESAHQELWVDGGQSEVVRRLDYAKLMKRIVCRVHEIFSGVPLRVVMEILKATLMRKPLW